MGLIKSALTKADRWSHYHRFECRPLCDLHDRVVLGAPRHLVREATESGIAAHKRAHSYLRHPANTGRS